MNSVLSRVRAIDLPAYGDEEVIFAAKVMERLRPTHVFEWGTNVGASARLFYETAQDLGFHCEVHTVELPIELAYLDRDHPGENRYGLWIQGLPIHGHLGDGLIESLRLYKETKPERALFFVDGCHEYKHVLNEFRSIAKAAPSAVILAHDTRHLAGPAKAVKTFLKDAPRRYLREVCKSDAGMTALWPASP